MREEYISPELEITFFEENDIITLSEDYDNYGDLNDLFKP